MYNNFRFIFIQKCFEEVESVEIGKSISFQSYFLLGIGAIV